MFPTSPLRLADLAFYSGWLLILLLFGWTRINTGDHVYFTGDGTLIVAMLEEMLASGDWTVDVGRIAHTFSLQKEWQGLVEVPTPGAHYFNLSGYVAVAVVFCKTFQILGFDALSIPFMLHGLNVLLQAMTLCLLFMIGKHMAGRNMGLLNMLFFALLPLAVTEAHYERPESWLAFLTTVILFASLKYAQAPKTSVLAIGIALGLSLAVKFSQLFLGIIPFLLLSSLATWRQVVIKGGILCLGLAAALVINVPFLLMHLPDYFREVASLSGFFDTPHPMYSIEHYHYLSQLLYIANYFQSTLGLACCLILLWGCYVCLFAPKMGVQMPLYYRLSLSIPPLFLLFYFSSKYNFMDRIFSSTEPMLCILLSIGASSLYQFVKKLSNQNIPLIAISFLFMALALYKPIELNYKFIQHHIRQPGHQPRIDFQEILKRDFRGFWIKNVHVTAGFSGAIPEKPEKAPRIYHFEDYNQYWTTPHLEKLKNNNFVHIATYCSDFHDLPASNYTIYHAAAKNHYLVRRDEWPAMIEPDYFETNCP